MELLAGATLGVVLYGSPLDRSFPVVGGFRRLENLGVVSSLDVILDSKSDMSYLSRALSPVTVTIKPSNIA